MATFLRVLDAPVLTHSHRSISFQYPHGILNIETGLQILFGFTRPGMSPVTHSFMRQETAVIFTPGYGQRNSHGIRGEDLLMTSDDQAGRGLIVVDTENKRHFSLASTIFKIDEISEFDPFSGGVPNFSARMTLVNEFSRYDHAG